MPHPRRRGTSGTSTAAQLNARTARDKAFSKPAGQKPGAERQAVGLSARPSDPFIGGQAGAQNNTPFAVRPSATFGAPGQAGFQGGGFVPDAFDPFGEGQTQLGGDPFTQFGGVDETELAFGAGVVDDGTGFDDPTRPIFTPGAGGTEGEFGGVPTPGGVPKWITQGILLGTYFSVEDGGDVWIITRAEEVFGPSVTQVIDGVEQEVEGFATGEKVAGETFTIDKISAGDPGLQLEQTAIDATNQRATKRNQLERDLAAINTQNNRDRIDADIQIAEGNWENALTIRDRINAQDDKRIQLERDLAALEDEDRDARFELDEARFEFEKLQFMSELARSPGDFATFFNISRGLEAPGAGGPIPGGFQRLAPLAIGDFDAGGGGAGQPGAPQGDQLALPPGATDVAGGAAPPGGDPFQPTAGATIDPGTGQPIGTSTTDELAGLGTPDQVAQTGAPLPPGLAAAFEGALPNSVGAFQAPEGLVPVLSPQQFNQLSPSEQEFYLAIAEFQGIRTEDFRALLQQGAPSQRRRGFTDIAGAA